MSARLQAFSFAASICISAAIAFAQTSAPVPTPIINLPSSKQLIGEAPGHPQRINSLPISMAISPDGRYVVTLNSGYGTFESQYDQSLAVLDTQTGKLADFPDPRTTLRAKQTLYSGLAFSRDGLHIYASMASMSDPKGEGPGDTGSGIVIYSFKEGRIAPERLIPLPVRATSAGTKDPPARWIEKRPRRALPGCDCGAGHGRPREAAGCGKSFRRCGASRRCDRRHREALRSL